MQSAREQKPLNSAPVDSDDEFDRLESDRDTVFQAEIDAPPAHGRSRKMRIATVTLVLLLLCATTAFFLLNRNQPAQTGLYKTASASIGDITQSVTASGSISPIKTVTVGSQVSGQIIDLKVDYNSLVTNGQVVAQLDPSTYQQSLVQAEADLASAKAAVSLAQLSYRRAKQLDEDKAKPHSEFEKAEVELAQAEATARFREAALKKAQVDLERTTIYSPIDGIVISRAVDVGQTVAANFNAPTLFSIAKDLREMRIQAAVSEADIGGVAEGEAVNFTVDAFPSMTFKGKVTQVRFEPSTNQNVVTYASIVDVRNEDLKLRPGMTANATIITAQKKGALRIPNAALRFKPSVSAADRAVQPKQASPALPQLPGKMPGPTPGAAGNGPAPSGEVQGPAMPPPDELQQSELGGALRTVYVPDSNQAQGAGIRAVRIMTGISDGTWTEVLEGLSESDVVVTGTATKQEAAASAKVASTRNPFGMGGPGGPPPR